MIRRAGWDHPLPRIRHRQGCPVEIKTAAGQTYRFCDHITAHTMRRTTITTLLMLGVDESVVRRISGHAAGSKEFYRYVVVVQDYLNSKVKAAQQKLVSPAALYGESFINKSHF
ncbi:MAG: site-specific integrase [Chitinophagaceae bacterium]|nr:site-specific integrase [Chitinophagaceae bacterium]